MPALPLVAPRGLRDLLPEASASLNALRKRVMSGFEGAGYGRVTTPAFEYADVLERGLEVARNEVFRFVEPDTGEVALLRPDITPQIARIVATRLADRPPPLRLSYQGTVIRRRDGRARRSRMAVQAGIECIGVKGIGGDLEVMHLACDTLLRVGLPLWQLELGQVAIARSALDPLPAALREEAIEALGRKDATTLATVAEKGRLGRGDRSRLLALCELYGGREVLRAAHRRYPAQRDALDALAQAFDTLSAHLDAVDGADVSIDLGELRGHAYYTGLSFTLLAEGPGASLGGGGRYDDLVGRFGQPMAATGFALDLDHLAWALTNSGVAAAARAPLRVLIATDKDASTVLRTLRNRGWVAATFPAGPRKVSAANAYAEAWHYDVVLQGRTARRLSDGTTFPLPTNWLETTDWLQAPDFDAHHRWAQPTLVE